MNEPTETKLTENAERLTSTLASLSAAMNAQGIASSLGTKSATALKIAEDLRIKQLSSLLKISEREARAKLATIKAEEDHSKAQDQIAADEAKRNKEAEEQAEKVKKAIEGAMKKAVDTVGGFAKGVLTASQSAYTSSEAFASAAPMIQVIGNVVKGVSSVIATAFSAIPFVGGVFSSVDKAIGLVTDISVQVMEMQLLNAQKYVNTYNLMSKAGATFGGSLTAMGVAAAAGGVNLASFGKFITGSAEDLSKLGSGITAAAGAVSKMGKEVLTNNKQLLVMYGGYDEVNSALATYSARLAASGYNTVTNQAKVNAGAKDYLFNLKAMTDLTGMSAKTMQAAENERLQEADYQAAKLAMGEKGILAEQAMTFATAGLGKEFAKYAAEYFANGRIISVTGQKLQAFNSAATQTARQLVDLARSATNEQDYNEKAAIILQGANAAIREQYNVDIARLGRASENADIKAIGTATQQTQFTEAFRQNTKEAWENLKKLQNEGKNDKGTKATAELIETLNKNQIATDEQVRKNLAASAKLADTLHTLSGKLMEFANKHLPKITEYFTNALTKLNEMLGPGDPSVPVFNGVDRALREQESRTAGIGAKNDVLKGKITKEGAAAILDPKTVVKGQEHQYNSDINAHGGKTYLEAIAGGKKHGEPGTPKPDFTGRGGADYQPEREANTRIPSERKADDPKRYAGLKYSGPQAFSGGPAKPALIALAHLLQGKYPEGIFTSFDDSHARGKSKHVGGEAVDFVLNGEWEKRLKEEKAYKRTGASTALIADIKALGFSKVLDEYTNPTEGTTNGHIHAELANGGIVSPSSNGLNATIGEGGRSELVTPLTNGRIPGMDELIERFDTMIKIMGDVGSNTDKMYRAVA